MRRTTFAALALAAAVLAVRPAAAQELVKEYPGLETGTMWTFDVPPLEYWARRFNFRPTPEWLDHARLSALRQPGCRTDERRTCSSQSAVGRKLYRAAQ